MKFSIPEPRYSITLSNDDATTDKLMIDDNGDLLHNDKKVENFDEYSKVLTILFKAVVGIGQMQR